ncbi:hypothetical protein ACQPYK_25295 [Streptosporangium sp. CA-135522]|uniref:hypothetical protein n=1 Tax=Streptosporangium sp. CA-135522 TaxID=3240072 RepID=UPI003D93C449
MKGHPRTNPIEAAQHFGACTCGSYRYASKKIAKLAARQIHPGRNLRAYRCGNYWHYGPLMVAQKRRRQLTGVRPSPVIVDEPFRMPQEAS